jgi:hypothetical protein
VTDYVCQRLLRIGQREEMIEIDPARTTPGEMLGHHGRFETIDKALETVQMALVQCVSTPE